MAEQPKLRYAEYRQPPWRWWRALWWGTRKRYVRWYRAQAFNEVDNECFYCMYCLTSNRTGFFADKYDEMQLRFWQMNAQRDEIRGLIHEDLERAKQSKNIK